MRFHMSPRGRSIEPCIRLAVSRVDPLTRCVGLVISSSLQASLVPTSAWLLSINGKAMGSSPTSFMIASLKYPPSFAEHLRLAGDFEPEQYPTQWASSIALRGRHK